MIYKYKKEKEHPPYSLDSLKLFKEFSLIVFECSIIKSPLSFKTILLKII